ncbi:uncharacterized protein LOC131655800 [Vicia villosa]|uniref:uncharacterized protein LOC131655799 n=1 Tax=Vicia villosa TaxID=3911 RepID=UPI00273B1C27|nr:uncharacterized protein LOC131655799 [Vicia villosa]XP_058781589.1 uncharacterized protein LOC131655799 [Vicia villosa]XP_058781590.1 uncharacterized protein LOC131655800 [Vicia villosa]XP_058781591.1 uncharacterized protein LOC131655800 [Vicia villosa]
MSVRGRRMRAVGLKFSWRIEWFYSGMRDDLRLYESHWCKLVAFPFAFVAGLGSCMDRFVDWLAGSSPLESQTEPKEAEDLCLFNGASELVNHMLRNNHVVSHFLFYVPKM